MNRLKLESIPSGVYKLEKLEELSVDNNQIHYFTIPSHLKKFSADNNTIDWLNDSKHFSDNLETLSLRNNVIKRVDFGFKLKNPFPKLKELYLSDNEIEEVFCGTAAFGKPSDHNGIATLTNLEYLDLKGNKIGWWQAYKLKRKVPNTKINR